MKKILLLLLLPLLAFSQDSIVPKGKFVSPWSKGDFFLGINSQGSDVSWSYLSLSPQIGYAPTDRDMLYGSASYSKSPRISEFRAGWNHRVYKSLYAGVYTSVFGESAQWPKNIGLELGVFKQLWGFLLVSPKVVLSDTWLNKDNQFNLQTAVSFAVKLH